MLHENLPLAGDRAACPGAYRGSPVNIRARNESKTRKDMKSPISLIALAGLLLASTPPALAGEEEPTLRDTKDWIIISGVGADFGDPQNGPLPWSVAIKKSTILSVTIDTHHSAQADKDGRPISYRGASRDELYSLPANIRVATSELAGSGNKVFHIGGLTHASAPLMLEKIIAATESPAKAQDKE